MQQQRHSDQLAKNFEKLICRYDLENTYWKELTQEQQEKILAKTYKMEANIANPEKQTFECLYCGDKSLSHTSDKAKYCKVIRNIIPLENGVDDIEPLEKKQLKKVLKREKRRQKEKQIIRERQEGGPIHNNHTSTLINGEKERLYPLLPNANQYNDLLSCYFNDCWIKMQQPRKYPLFNNINDAKFTTPPTAPPYDDNDLQFIENSFCQMAIQDNNSHLASSNNMTTNFKYKSGSTIETPQIKQQPNIFIVQNDPFSYAKQRQRQNVPLLSTSRPEYSYTLFKNKLQQEQQQKTRSIMSAASNVNSSLKNM